jgi:hypothetical protein
VSLAAPVLCGALRDALSISARVFASGSPTGLAHVYTTRLAMVVILARTRNPEAVTVVVKDSSPEGLVRRESPDDCEHGQNGASRFTGWTATRRASGLCA